jgi:uncharacterized protein (TIGR00251 family)
MTVVRVHVVPGAKVDSVVREHAGAIKIKLHAPAVEGKANADLIRFFCRAIETASAFDRTGTRSSVARQSDSNRSLDRGRCAHPNARESLGDI